ncbi:MAG: general secretion pathway protein GspB [Alkalimonas sp.]|nr:general secretion pathway protein GspB [Alkalimonas sp.]
MSILMDALKRQQQHSIAAPAANARSPFWLGLLVGMIGLSLALAVGYWLGLQHQAAEPPVKQPVAEASQQHILAALMAESKASDEKAESAAGSEAADASVTSSETKVEAQSEPEMKPQQEVTPQLAAQDEPQQLISAERPARASMPSLSDIDELDVTSELQQRFSQALDATSQQDASRQNVRMHDAPAVDIRELDELTRRQLPAMRFEAHVYASTAAQRWVKVNGRTLQQGQWLSTDVQVVEILPNHVLLRFHQQEFSVEALTDWG